MKNALYVATVCRAYRDAIDTCLKDPQAYQQKITWYREQVRSCTYRDFCTGFFYGKPDESSQVYEGEAYHEGRTYLGIVGDPAGAARQDDSQPCCDVAQGEADNKHQQSRSECGADSYTFFLEQKNKFSVGDVIEIMGFDGTDRAAEVLSITDAEGLSQPDAPHAKQQLTVTLSESAHPGEVLRR